MLKNIGFTTSVPSSSTSDNSLCTSTSNIFPEASTSEVRPFIPTDSEQNKGDDSEKGDNEEVQSNNESNRDRKSEEDKDRPERFIDLDVEMLNDIALWPKTLTDLMIDYIIRKKPNNIGIIETLKSANKDRDQVNEFGKVEEEATALSGLSFEKEVGQACRQRRRKIIFGETKEEGHEFENRENFLVNSFYVICDRTSAELSRRAGIYETIIEHFFVFFDERLPEIKKKAVQKLKDIYKDDIELFNYDDELNQFLLFLKENKDTMNTPIEIYRVAREMVSTFPNVEILLKIFLTIPISNTSGERSFIVLKRVKNYLRSSREDKLNSMAILYIEQDVLDQINTAKIFDEFAQEKST
ncbi:dimer_Tnp_hAT domain-containing protein [Nephila pilipes]|uniref:Dimer_Tnp_hAT domain-containing protein n=1 Tax=Nephila pilipes TaxID=299642 RepID=A0A8X6USH5_NEPPI|nr:dimer_Tnp_hAT domain-containing protein [Nephila pilipes]